MDQTVSPLSDVFFQALEAFCRRRHIRRLSLFGSVVRGDFRPDSDMDTLIAS
jgi:predicted nucleotidyltransferase